MVADRVGEFLGIGGLRHLRQRFDEILFSIIKIADVIDKDFFQSIKFHCGPAFTDWIASGRNRYVSTTTASLTAALTACFTASLTLSSSSSGFSANSMFLPPIS